MNPAATVLFIALMLTSARAEISVFAAASTTDVMKELAEKYKAGGGEEVRFNFASSGALARQIDAGAPADLFISANTEWMDWLEQQENVHPTGRFVLAANTLVLAAPQGAALTFDGNVDGRIAVGDFRSVPAGMYACEALTHMGWLERWKPKLVMASNVRTALLYVQRGEVTAGIVYATDAKAAGLAVIGTFPAESHRPIVYPAAALSNRKAVAAFLRFLQSEAAKAILKKHGFTEPTDPLKTCD